VPRPLERWGGVVVHSGDGPWRGHRQALALGLVVRLVAGVLLVQCALCRWCCGARYAVQDDLRLCRRGWARDYSQICAVKVEWRSASQLVKQMPGRQSQDMGNEDVEVASRGVHGTEAEAVALGHGVTRMSKWPPMVDLVVRIRPGGCARQGSLQREMLLWTLLRGARRSMTECVRHDLLSSVAWALSRVSV
jgi:hypothetical protein